MLRLLRIFFEAPGARPGRVITALLLAAIVEGIGIATLLPVITVAVEGGDGEKVSSIGRIGAEIMQTVGVTPQIGPLLIFLGLTLVLKSACSYAATRYVGFTSARVATGLRMRLARALLSVRHRFLIHLPQGRIANLMAGHAAKSGEAYVAVATVYALTIQCFCYVLLAFVVTWQIALIALAIGGAIALVLSPVISWARRASQMMRERSRDLMVLFGDTISNLKPIRAMARHEAYARLLNKKTQRLERALRRQSTAREALDNLQDALVAIFLCSGFFIVHDVVNVPIAQILVSGIVIARMVTTVGKLQKAYQRAVLVEAHYFALQEMIVSAEAVPEINTGKAKPTFERGAQFTDVSFGYDGNPVIKGAYLSVPAGRLSVLTGSSGAGKTTLVDLLLGMHQPDQGEVSIDGVPLRTIDLFAWRRMVGYVPQEMQLLHATVRENITLGDEEITEDEIMTALRVAGAGELTADLPSGLDTLVGERGARLSGGQRQRIALARAVVCRPRLLILDEVTSALDPQTELQVCNNIKELTPGVTVLAITHRPAWLAVADLVYHLHEGRVDRRDRGVRPSLELEKQWSIVSPQATHDAS